MAPPLARPRRAAGWLLALTLGATSAQALAPSTLAGLLPGNTVAAFGLIGASDAAERAGPLADALAEAGLAEVWTALGAALGIDLPEAGALLGREAFVAIGADRFAPIPAVTLLALVEEATARTVLAGVAATGAPTYREGALAFTQLANGIAVAVDGSLVAAASNADALRAVLRLRAGAPEPRFDRLPGVEATLGALESGVAVAYLDAGAFARALAPLARGLGADASVARLTALLETPGPTGGIARLDEAGLTSIAIRLPPAEPRDRALHALLTKAPLAPRTLLAHAPADATGVSVSGFDAAGWFAYLSALLADVRELSVPDLARTLRDLFGIDVERDLLAWTEPGVIQIAGVGGDALAEFGVLGLRSRDDDAATAGLGRAFARVHALAAGFARSAPPAPRVRTVAGATLHAFDVLPDLTLAFAVRDGVAWLSANEGALERLLMGAGAGANAEVTAAFAAAPANAEAVSFGRLALESAAGWVLGIPSLAALAGDRIDADAVALAAERVAAALQAIAPRVGASVAWSGMDGVRWRREERTWLTVR